MLNFRRPKRTANRAATEEPAAHLKSSSELNLNTASTSVPIRTTRASRLRAAAANHSDSPLSHKKSIRSSSVQSLVEDGKSKSPKNSKILDRDKKSPAKRRQSHEKENKFAITTVEYSDKDIGAINTKSKHSITKTNLGKDKNYLIVTSPKRKITNEKHRIEEGKNNSITYEKKDCDEKTNQFLNVNDKEKIDILFNNLVADGDEVQNGFELKIDEILNDKEGLKFSHNSANNPADNEAIACNSVECINVESSVVPIVKEEVGGLLGAVCVRKVERFSELLSNLCSPCEADILFEDILVENGINGDSSSVSLISRIITIIPTCIA